MDLWKYYDGDLKYPDITKHKHEKEIAKIESMKSQISFRDLPAGRYNLSVTKMENREKLFTKEIEIKEGKKVEAIIP